MWSVEQVGRTLSPQAPASESACQNLYIYYFSFDIIKFRELATNLITSMVGKKKKLAVYKLM